MEKLNMTANNGSNNLTAAAVHRRRQHRSYREQLDERVIDRSGKKKRRGRGEERILHEDSSDETLEYGEEDEFSVKFSPSFSSSYNQSPLRTENLKTDVVLRVHVPRKARSAMKRSCRSWISGGVGGIKEDRSVRQLSTSPSMSPAHISSGAGRKRLKTMSGGKLRPSRSWKTESATLVEDELEVAEVLFGLTRQFESEGQKVNDEFRNETKSGAVKTGNMPVVIGGNYSDVRMGNSKPMIVIAPKRKKPRKIYDESPESSIGVNSFQGASISSAAKTEKENLMDTTSSQQSEKKNESPSVPDVVLSNPSIPIDEDFKLPEMTEKAADLKSSTMKSEQVEVKGEAVYDVKENTCSNLGTSTIEETKSLVVNDKSAEVKFTIDLMAPPSEKLSTDDENDLCSHDQKAMDATSVVKIEMEKKDKEKLDQSLAEREVDKSLEESDSKCQKGKEIIKKLQFDLERTDEDNIDSNKIHAQKQQKALDSKQEKSVQNASSSTPLIVAGWQGNFPSFGYTGQVPPGQVVLPVDASSGSPSILQPSIFLSPQPRPKRCATHCYIAQQILYHQRFARANPIWSAATAAAAGAIPLYGAKQLGPNGVPASDGAILGNAVQGNFPAMNACSSKDNHETSRAMVGNKSSKEILSSGSAITEGVEKKQFVVPPQSASGPNMPPGPTTFLFPVNQQQAVASTATTVTGTSKSTPPNGNSALASGPTSSVNFNFAGLASNEAQYLALVQNSGYPFPVAATSQQYKGLTPAGTIPIFNSQFYSSQVLHLSQIQQQQAMASYPVPPHQAYQNANKSAVSSSSTKHPQLPQQVPGAGATSASGSPHGPAESEKRSSSNHAEKNHYDKKYAMPISPQNLTLLSTANPSAVGGGVGAQTDKQNWNHNQMQSQQKQSGRLELPSSQVFAMPFTSFNGMTALPPGLDFSSVPQNGILLQNLPEQFRQQYGHMNIPAGPATSYLAQQKTQNHNADGSALVSKESRSANGKSEEDGRKVPSTSGKTLGSSSQHTLTFSRPDESVASSILNNNAVDNSSRTLNLMANHSASSTAATTAGSTTTMNIPSSQQLNQLQKHQQKQMLMHNQYPSSRTKVPSSNNSPVMYTERLPPNLPGSKFPQPLTGFPQTAVQGGNVCSSSMQSPQWKANARPAATSQMNAASQLVIKNNVGQQGRAVQQPMSSQSHQNHQNLISFGANMMKTVPSGLQHTIPTSSQPSAAVINPPQSSGYKGSPSTAQASSSAKPMPSASVLSFPQQSSSPKISLNSTQKSSSAPGSREPAAGTSQTNVVLTNNSGTKLQHQLSQQVPQQSQKSQHNQAQIFFPNGFLQQTHPAQPNAAARFYHPRPPDQSHQQNSSSGCSTVVTESTAAVSANSSNGLSSPGLIHAAQLAVAAQASTLVPATFPYMSAPTVSVKPATE